MINMNRRQVLITFSTLATAPIHAITQSIQTWSPDDIRWAAQVVFVDQNFRRAIDSLYCSKEDAYRVALEMGTVAGKTQISNNWLVDTSVAKWLKPGEFGFCRYGNNGKYESPERSTLFWRFTPAQRMTNGHFQVKRTQ